MSSRKTQVITNRPIMATLPHAKLLENPSFAQTARETPHYYNGMPWAQRFSLPQDKRPLFYQGNQGRRDKQTLVKHQRANRTAWKSAIGS